MTLPQDQGTALSDMTILLPGEEPQGAEGTVVANAAASPSGDEENLRAAYEAAGVTPPATPQPAAPATALDPALVEALKAIDPTQLPPDVQ